MKCLRSEWGLTISAVTVREHPCVCFGWVSSEWVSKDRKAIDEIAKSLCTGRQLPSRRIASENDIILDNLGPDRLIVGESRKNV